MNFLDRLDAWLDQPANVSGVIVAMALIVFAAMAALIVVNLP